MKRRIISIILTAIMAISVIQPTASAKGTLPSGFSETPKDVTPVKQDYSPGLGDRMDAISYTIGLGWLGSSTGLSVVTTYDQALTIQRGVYNITNGAHQVAYALGQDVLRWGSSPYLLEDTAEPMGDGTPGSGFRKYREYVDASFANNADVAQILEPLLAGRMREDYATGDDKIPLSCYTHDENGNKKVGWTAGDEYWYLLSLYNLYESGYAQSAWQRMKDTWNFRTHLYYDAMIPVPEGLYNNPNLTTQYGGVITNTEMEWDAVQRETAYSWENYAISSGQEYVHPKYKGLSCYFSVPYGVVTDIDYMNTWGNSVMVSNRGDEPMNLVWGSEVSTTGDDAFQFNGNHQPWNAFITRLMEHNFQYLYMMERKPLSYTNNGDIYQVVFSGDLVSTYDKKTGNYTLVENGDFIIADGGDRFIPQVGAGCKIFAYSRSGKTRTWKLPETWASIGEVDRYLLAVNSAPTKVDTLSVTDGCVTVNMTAGKPYLLVPKGDDPTPLTANFNELDEGTTLGTYQGLDFAAAGNPAIKVYGASARGGFGSPSVYADSTDESAVITLGMGSGAILHSLKVGNKGGAGRVVLHSSNPLNEDVMITLPETDQVLKFNTGWAHGELGEVSVLIENENGVSNVLFDAIMYSATSAAASCAGGGHEYEHRHADALCGSDGRDSDVCVNCGAEKNVTVIPAIAGSHAFTDDEAVLTATEYNPGKLVRYCPKCGYTVETDVPTAIGSANHAFHHDFGFNYMQIDNVRPYASSNGTVVFDVVPIDVMKRSDPAGPCYIGVWFGSSYSICAGYDFSAQKFVIGKNSLSFPNSISSPYASKSYSWTKTESGGYQAHRFAFNLSGNTATIYLDGVKMLSSRKSAYASSDDIVLIYTKGECVLDNIVVANSTYDVANDTGNTVMRVDFENGSAALTGWTLGGYITTDIREFDMRDCLPSSHAHSNVLVASHEANYIRGSYDEYECASCHKRTVIETGGALTGDALCHMKALEPTCTLAGHTEYWYDRQGKRFSDAAGTAEISPEQTALAALGHELEYHPAAQAASAEDSFVEYWRCARCERSFADEGATREISLIKSEAVRAVEREIEAIGEVRYREESPITAAGIIGTFGTGSENTNYSLFDVGNSGSKLNADYTVEMTLRVRDVDTATEIGGASGAFFGMFCENLTVGYDFASDRWGVSPTSGLFASYAFHPSEVGTLCVLDDGYFHKVTIECTTSAIRVFVDGSCVLNARSLVRENNRYCIFYPRLCTVDFANYAFKYNGSWVNDHLTSAAIVTASTWKDRGSGYSKTVHTFTGSTLVDSLRTIEYAESLYNALPADEKLLVTNRQTLATARKTYDALAGAILYGDADGDGEIMAKDLVLIRQYLAGHDGAAGTSSVEVAAGADANGDGAISTKDIVILRRYIANYDEATGTSSVVLGPR